MTERDLKVGKAYVVIKDNALERVRLGEIIYFAKTEKSFHAHCFVSKQYRLKLLVGEDPVDTRSFPEYTYTCPLDRLDCLEPIDDA